jgi:hypothetical protein
MQGKVGKGEGEEEEEEEVNVINYGTTFSMVGTEAL